METLHTISHSILSTTTTRQVKCFLHSHYTDEETEVQRLIWQLQLLKSVLTFFPTTAVHPQSHHILAWQGISSTILTTKGSVGWFGFSLFFPFAPRRSRSCSSQGLCVLSSEDEMTLRKNLLLP